MVMKKSDFEVLSLALLAAACGPDPDNQETKSTSASQATAPAAPSEPMKSPAQVTPPMVGSSFPPAALGRTGRTGGFAGEMPDEALGRTGRGGGIADGKPGEALGRTGRGAGRTEN
jgi:hypothetical protein